MGYGNTKTPSKHRRLGNGTLSQLAFPGEGNPNFPWEKAHWDNTVIESKKKVKVFIVDWQAKWPYGQELYLLYSKTAEYSLQYMSYSDSALSSLPREYQ